MMYIIEYSKDADKTLRKWKKSNPRLFKKATKILLDIMEHPRTGLGHPEPLVGGHDVTYSRHITAFWDTRREPEGQTARAAQKAEPILRAG